MPPRSPSATVPTLGVVEVSSIPRGLRVCDLMLKKAPVRVLRAAPVGCGKFLITLTGDEASLQEALDEGRAAAEPHLVGWTCLPNAHPQVVRALAGEVQTPGILDALGALETLSLASLVRAADAAVKAAEVRLLSLTLDRDLGGKGYFTITGPLAEVEAALEAAERLVLEAGHPVQREILARPHEGLGAIVAGA